MLLRTVEAEVFEGKALCQLRTPEGTRAFKRRVLPISASAITTAGNPHGARRVKPQRDGMGWGVGLRITSSSVPASPLDASLQDSKSSFLLSPRCMLWKK